MDGNLVSSVSQIIPKLFLFDRRHLVDMISGRFLLLLLMGSTPAFLPAQTVEFAPLVGYGYNLPRNGINAAPGQTMMISLWGIQPRTPYFSGPLVEGPTEIDGISATLFQDAKQTPIALFGFRQASCGESSSSCLTTLTLKVPLELQAPAAQPGSAWLRVSDRGKTVGDIFLQSVSDSIHVYNTCENTFRFGAVGDVDDPQGCLPAVAHVNGNRVTKEDPAQLGEILSVWTFGVGAVDPSITTGNGQPYAKQKIGLGFDARPNAPAMRPPASTAGKYTATAILGDSLGTYLIQFVLPSDLAGPFVPCDGVTVRSNLTITLAGANSIDAVPICVAP
jgi:hypothetical protein